VDPTGLILFQIGKGSILFVPDPDHGGFVLNIEVPGERTCLWN